MGKKTRMMRRKENKRVRRTRKEKKRRSVRKNMRGGIAKMQFKIINTDEDNCTYKIYINNYSYTIVKNKNDNNYYINSQFGYGTALFYDCEINDNNLKCNVKITYDKKNDEGKIIDEEGNIIDEGANIIVLNPYHYKKLSKFIDFIRISGLSNDHFL